MRSFEFADSPYFIRQDLVEAYRVYWDRLSSPGAWWTGRERVEIAAEARRALSCSICDRRGEALSPGTGYGEHEASEQLTQASIDAIHRVINDPTRITASYVSESDLTEEAYVELVGIVTVVYSIDESMRALGLVVEPLPTPQAGDPSWYRPPRVLSGAGFVAMIPRDGAVGRESDLWSGDRSANVLRALSLVPDAVRDWYLVADAQYLSIPRMRNFSGRTGRALDRRQMELVAGRVSACNECFY